MSLHCQKQKNNKAQLLRLPWWSSGLMLQASKAGTCGSITGQGTKIPHAMRYGQPPPTPQNSACIAMIRPVTNKYKIYGQYNTELFFREFFHFLHLYLSVKFVNLFLLSSICSFNKIFNEHHLVGKLLQGLRI